MRALWLLLPRASLPMAGVLLLVHLVWLLARASPPTAGVLLRRAKLPTAGAPAGDNPWLVRITANGWWPRACVYCFCGNGERHKRPNAASACIYKLDKPNYYIPTGCRTLAMPLPARETMTSNHQLLEALLCSRDLLTYVNSRSSESSKRVSSSNVADDRPSVSTKNRR